MTDDATLTLTLDAALRDRFVAEADAALRPAEDVLRDLVRDFVARRDAARDAEIRAEIEQALREADDPDARFIGDDDVAADWLRQRAELLQRVGRGPA